MLNQYKAEPSTGLTERPISQQVLRSFVIRNWNIVVATIWIGYNF